MDKGFYSAKNINILDEMNLQYIIPLKRDCDLIDYSKASVDYLDEGGEAFRYHGREIYMYRKDIDDNHSIDLCVDCSMRSAETNDFQTRIHDNLNKRVEFQDERYTWKNFKEKRKTMGTIAFLTNNKLMMTKVDENRKPILDENGNEQKERAILPIRLQNIRLSEIWG